MTDLHLNVFSVLASFAILVVTIVGLISIGLIMGSQMESPEGFQLISTFVIMPMFFLSGALFPIDNLPSWLSPVVLVDPVTYSVDGLRAVMLGTSHFSFALDFVAISVFSLVMVAIGTYAFKKMKV
jgi:ABC-2 type transport system permease protein